MTLQRKPCLLVSINQNNKEEQSYKQRNCHKDVSLSGMKTGMGLAE